MMYLCAVVVVCRALHILSLSFSLLFFCVSLRKRIGPNGCMTTQTDNSL